MITQDMIDVTLQRQRQLFVKINILNNKKQIVDEISGNLIGGGINIDADSDIRRTCDIELVVNDSTFKISPYNKIWIDNTFKVEIGIKKHRGNIIWFNQGEFIIDEPSWTYNASENILSFQGLDMMANLTGDRRGVLTGLPVVIKQGTLIRTAILDMLSLANINNYIIVDNDQYVPQEITSKLGDTIYDILSEIRDLTPNYQIYFDLEGVFHYEPIPNGVDNAVIIDDNIFKNITTNENIDIDFSNIKNYVEVWGQSISVRDEGIATLNGSTYITTITDVDEYRDEATFGITINNIAINPYLNINSLGSKRILNENGTFAIIPEINQQYVFEYRESQDAFIFLGYQQVNAFAQDDNPNSPYYINGTIGIIPQVLEGQEYENIVTKEMCQERANWELYLSTSKHDSIKLSCVPIYYADVNILVSYTNKDNETNLYMIKSISTDFSVDGEQSLNMIRFYPSYPYY